jgi:exodeoxyribonuclease VII large subunit
MRARVAARERRLQQRVRALEAVDLGRRLGAIHSQLVEGRAKLDAAITRRRHRADARLAACAGRLETLSPLAVLGRGYAVCWDDQRTRAIRDASTVAAGDRVRVTLAKGELDCEVREPS